MTFFSKFKFPLVNNQPTNVDECAKTMDVINLKVIPMGTIN